MAFLEPSSSRFGLCSQGYTIDDLDVLGTDKSNESRSLPIEFRMSWPTHDPDRFAVRCTIIHVENIRFRLVLDVHHARYNSHL